MAIVEIAYSLNCLNLIYKKSGKLTLLPGATKAHNVLLGWQRWYLQRQHYVNNCSDWMYSRAPHGRVSFGLGRSPAFCCAPAGRAELEHPLLTETAVWRSGKLPEEGARLLATTCAGCRDLAPGKPACARPWSGSTLSIIVWRQAGGRCGDAGRLGYPPSGPYFFCPPERTLARDKPLCHQN